MDSNIEKILLENQEKGDGYYTHTSQIRPTGRFNFSRKVIENFWDVYCERLHKDPDMVSGVAERPLDYLPILADIDIKIPYEPKKHSLDEKLYDQNHLKQTIIIYQKHLKQIIKEYKPEYGICFLLEKELPTYNKEKETIGHGFHLHFPFTIMHRIDQDVHLIPRIKKETTDKQLFQDLGIKESGDVIDKSCTNKQWLLYGSRKKEYLQRYSLTKIFDDNCKELTLEEACENFTLKDVHGDIIPIVEDLEYYLPRILSIHPEHKDAVQVKHDLSIITKAYLKKAKDSKKVYEDLPIPEALRKAKELMKFISATRADNYEDWMDIGWTLFSIGDACEEALDMWVDFSSKTTKKNNFSEKVCMYEWDRMEKRGKTIGSLYHYAKADDKEGYKKFLEKEEKQNINDSLNGGHYDLAKILYNKYRDEFVCACPTKDIWYRYKDHRWHIEEKGMSLRKKISTYLTDIYEKKKKKILHDMADDGEESPEYQKKIKVVNKLLSNLKSSPFKKNIMCESQELFHDPEFIKNLNQNAYLLHFTNGILDLKEMTFRDGRPKDYLSLTTGYDFKNDYTHDNIDVVEVDDLMNKTFPDPILKRYFLEYAANLLKGGNNIKTFLVMSGGGDNAKSVMMDFLELVLGEYMKVLPTTLITGKRTQSSGHTAELDDLEGVRFAILQEPSAKDVINIGILKELSGNDKIYKRGMYQKATSFKPLFKLGLICLAGDSRVSLASGMSVRIDKLKTQYNKGSILSWNEDLKGLVNNKQIGFLDQGIKNCVELTFSDGRKITCTPDHKFLDSEGKWIEAQKITIEKIKFGADYADCSDIFDKEVNNHYKMANFDFFDINDRLKACAMMRLMGYVMTDGSNNKTLYIGHKIDTFDIIEDIKLLTGKSPSVFTNNLVYQTSLPESLVRDISKFVKMQLPGGKVRNEMTLPEFIFEENCPKFLIREFIASLFGGDGIIPCISRNKFSTISLVCSKNSEHVNSLVKEFTRLSNLMEERFGIKSFITKPRLYDEVNNHYQVFLKIHNTSRLKFIENIGTRYCGHKAYRLTAVASSIRYRKSILSQNNKIIDRTKDLLDKYKRQNPLAKIEQRKLDGTLIKVFETTQKAQHETGINHSQIRGACLRNGTCHGFKWTFLYDKIPEILDEPGCKDILPALKKSITEIKESDGIIDEKYLLTYSQVGSYIRKNIPYKQPSTDLNAFLEKTDLYNFCNDFTGKFHYSVHKDSNVLPTFHMNVISIKNIGEKNVYDLCMDDPYNSFVANGAVVHNCNKLPRLPCDDPAAWNRIRVLLFESCFPKDQSLVPESVEEQFRQKIFPRNPTFSEKLPKLKQAFMWLLWEMYKQIAKDGRMPEPDKVREATSLYRRNNDVFLQFIEERIVEDDNEKAVMSVTEVYSSFKTWFHESYPNTQVPTKEDMKEDLITRWGNLSRSHKWNGYRLRTTEDDEREGKAIIIREEDLLNEDSNEDSEKKISKKRKKNDDEEEIDIIDDSEDDSSDEDSSDEDSDED